MFSAAVIVLCSIFGTITAQEPPGGYYTTRYDHLDIENILNQKRLVHYYSACLLDKGPCTPQGIEFKRILPEAIKTNCLRCTEKQRVVTLRSIRRLRKEYPDVWGQLEKSWDPTGEYLKKLEGFENRPIPIPSSTTTRAPDTTLAVDVVPLANRFDDGTTAAPVLTSEATKPSTTTAQDNIQPYPSSVVRSPTEIPSTSTTLNIIISSLQPKTTTTTTTKKTTTTAKPAVTRRQTTKSRPFSSIGPNLIVPNPKALLDKVFLTAGAVLNSVTNGVTSVTNTFVNVLKG